MKMILLDIGGVLLSNGWDSQLRKKIILHFGLEESEFNSRHHLLFDSFERGKISFEQYLRGTIFYEKRGFSQEEVKNFAFEQAEAFSDMILYIKEYKMAHGVKIAALSNEGKEIAQDRIERFNLNNFIDFFVISGCVHLRKPDPEIYQLVLDLAQLPAQEIVYIEDRYPFVEMGRSLGMHAIHHTTKESTESQLESYSIGVGL